MRICKKQHDAADRLAWLALAAWLMQPVLARPAEDAFPLLQIGTRTYTNVTVTTKAKTYIFIFHTGGMNSIKVADLSPEVREQLGYASAEKPKASTNSTAADWAKMEVAKLETPQVKEIGQKLARRWHASTATGLPPLALVTNRMILAVLAIIVASYLLHCYCFMLICQKAGHPPGLLVWLPVFQLFPLLRAAGMSGWWFVAWLLPLLNIVALILWSVKITKARGKSTWVAVFLILPVTSFLAILYLAFSNGARARQEGEEPKVMSLQAA